MSGLRESSSAATFQGTARFAAATIGCKALFNGAILAQAADFADCTFTHPANFREARFDSAASFERVTFLQYADFRNAAFAGSFVLSPPQASQGLAPSIFFESVTLGAPEKVRFTNISFERISLMGTNLRGVRLEMPKWPKKGLLRSTKRAVLYDEIQKEKPDPQKLAHLYQDIRANLRNSGATADLGDLFYSEMEVRRKQRRGDGDALYVLRRYLSPYTLFWLICGYGRKPLRLIVTATVIGLAYWGIF